MFVCCGAAPGQPSPWRVDDANVVFQVSSSAQQDADALRNYELISKVKQLRLEGAVQQTHVDALLGYTMLKELFLEAPNLKTVAFTPLQQLPQLSSLTIRSREFSGESLAQLPQLRKLDVAGCPISRDGFKAIGELRLLRALLVGDTGLSDEAFADLQNLRMLTSLSLVDLTGGSAITGKGLSLLAAHPFLEKLDMEFSAPSEIAQIPTLRYLKQLYISSKTETDLQNISRFAGLEILVVNLETLTSESAQEIARLKRLQVLNTHYCNILPAAATALSRCENLEAFYTENQHGPELLRTLSQLQCLRKLGLVSLSDEDAKHLIRASLLQSLYVRKDATDRAMAAIAELPHLSELHLQSCSPEGILTLKQAKSLELFLLFGTWEEEHQAAVKELRTIRPHLGIRQRFGF
jgi:Leucine-rich repeat (LRR) protein